MILTKLTACSGTFFNQTERINSVCPIRGTAIMHNKKKENLVPISNRFLLLLKLFKLTDLINCGLIAIWEFTEKESIALYT